MYPCKSYCLLFFYRAESGTRSIPCNIWYITGFNGAIHVILIGVYAVEVYDLCEHVHNQMSFIVTYVPLQIIPVFYFVTEQSLAPDVFPAIYGTLLKNR